MKKVKHGGVFTAIFSIISIGYISDHACFY